jgi:hypothetical protein
MNIWNLLLQNINWASINGDVHEKD